MGEAAKASSQVETKMASFDKPLERAVSFLLESSPSARSAQRRNGGKQAYAAAISTYALALARAYRPSLLTEEILSAVMSELKSLGIKEDGLAHWGGAAQDARLRRALGGPLTVGATVRRWRRLPTPSWPCCLRGQGATGG